MKATNNSLRAMEELTWTGLQEMNLLFDQNHLEGTPDPGVLADDDRGYRFQKYVFTEGSGLSYANRRTAEDVK